MLSSLNLCVAFLQIFNFNQKPTEEEEGDDEDLSDSEDSAYSGLEDSGSDIEDDEEEEKESDEEEDDDDDLKVEPKQIEQVEFFLCKYCLAV